MKKIISVAMTVAVMIVSAGVIVRSAGADEVRMVGTILKIEMKADGTSANTILKDSLSGDSVSAFITDELILEKLIEKRIVEGDEIGCKYKNIDGKNHIRMLKIKTASY